MKHHTKEKGDLALTKIIADLTEKGFDILLPISENLPFDLIAYKDNISYRIQSKYTTKGNIADSTSWTDKNGSHKRKYDYNDFDYYGLYLPNINICVYPSIKFAGSSIRSTMPRSAASFYWYEDFLTFTIEANKKSYKDFDINLSKTLTDKAKQAHLNSRKITRPSKENLEKLVWEKPTIQLAKEFGVSDNAITKWCKAYGISKPPRGYWAKQK